MTQEPITTTVSLSQKVNLGNYESVDFFISVSGVSAETTDAEIEAALDAGKIAYDKIRGRMAVKVAEARNTAGWGKR